MSVAKLFTAPVPEEHADTLLELSFLVAAIDGRLDDAELDAFRALVGQVRGASPTDAQVDALLDRFAVHIEPREIEARVRELAPTLPSDVGDLAFKVSIGLGLVDMDESAAESQLHDAFAEALGLSEDKRGALTAEVHEALDAGGD
ncbi:MAG: hypothetical protein KC657_13200 [Myxococcales bacterium]|nr:hypothetical protein [Myxococcales bacterium]